MSRAHLTAGVLAILSRAARGVQMAALPNSCAFCGTRLRLPAAPVCDACASDLPWIDKACGRCAAPLAAELPHDVWCADCQQAPPPFTTALAPLSYAFPIDAAIRALKFHRKLYYASVLSDILLQSISRVPQDVDALLPVPLHWRRQARRGFNQAIELCRPICRRTGIAMLQQLVRCRATPYQSGLAAQHRRRNLQAAFNVRGRIRAHHVLIVDDVITTGATCRELASVLLEAGVRRVSVLAVARAARD